MKLLNSLIFLLLLTGCKAQQLPSFVTTKPFNFQMSDSEYISWYNSTVQTPKMDTVSLFQVPEKSTIRYVIVRNLAKTPARVELQGGRFVMFLEQNYSFVEQVKFNEKGEIVQGLSPITISSPDAKGLYVQFEKCEKCKIARSKKGQI